MNLGNRKDENRNKRPGRGTPIRNIKTATSRRNHRAKKAEILNEALLSLVALVYDQDEVGYCNIDRDGRLLVCTPWSKHNYTRWGLRKTESEVLRAIMMDQQKVERREALFIFEHWQWFLNLGYRNKAQGRAWVEAVGINAQTWHKYQQQQAAKRGAKWTAKTAN